MKLNAEDGGKRKFIMVQLPEKTYEKSEAYQAGYKTICDIGKERIRRAGDKILSELQKDKPAWADGETTFDIGFKVFKLDSSNIKRWDASPIKNRSNVIEELLQRLHSMTNTIRSDRTELDVVYEIMLKFGIDLSTLVEKLDFAGLPAYMVGGGLFIACLEPDISIEMLEAMADSGAGTIFFAEECFLSDTAMVNAECVLKYNNVDIMVI